MHRRFIDLHLTIVQRTVRQLRCRIAGDHLGLPMKHVILAFCLSSFLAGPAFADVEKIAQLCGEQICFRWWPRVEPPDGWKQERGQSLHYNFNALAPAESDFATAEAVMYANAIYRPRVPNEKTLSAFIDSDIQNFKADNPGLVVAELPTLRTADGKTARLFLLKPTTQGQWERVAYFEEGEYYMVFVASSRTESGLLRVASAHESLITHYREKP